MTKSQCKKNPAQKIYIPPPKDNQDYSDRELVYNDNPNMKIHLAKFEDVDAEYFRYGEGFCHATPFSNLLKHQQKIFLILWKYQQVKKKMLPTEYVLAITSY